MFKFMSLGCHLTIGKMNELCLKIDLTKDAYFGKTGSKIGSKKRPTLKTNSNLSTKSQVTFTQRWSNCSISSMSTLIHKNCKSSFALMIHIFVVLHHD